MIDWKVGDLVVCVDGKWGGWSPAQYAYYSPNLPRENEIYTVRRLGVGFYRNCPNVACVWLDEIINPIRWWGEANDEAPFACDRFRPVSRKWSEEFRRLTAPQPHINVRDLVE